MREEAKENMATAMRHHLFILLLPEVNKVMLVIIAAHVKGARRKTAEALLSR